MIARADKHHVVRVDGESRQRDCRCGIATQRLDKEQRIGRNRVGLRAGKFEVAFADDHDGTSEDVAVAAARQGCFVERLVAQQRNERFRLAGAAARPEARSAATAQHDRYNS